MHCSAFIRRKKIKTSRILIYLSALISILLFSNVAFCVPIDVEVKVDKDTVTIGDKITYELRVEYDDGIRIEPIDAKDHLKEFEIKHHSVSPPKKLKSDRWISTSSYIITIFKTGEFTIPPVEVRYRDLNGNPAEILSQEVKINVKSVMSDFKETRDLRPLKEPVEIKVKPLIWPILLIILVVIAAAAVFIYFRKNKIIEQVPIGPPKLPEEIAIEELKALLDDRLIEKGMIKQYYIRLSDILRKYIEGKFKILALDMTTWELYREMRVKKIEIKKAEKIRDFLEDCDLVKFAKYIPEKKEIDEAYNTAKEIVDRGK